MADQLQTGIIITDCRDDNARVRQQSRFMALFGLNPAFLGVGGSAPDLEAGGNLIDQLDAATTLPAAHAHGKTVILVNVAPRGEDIKHKWDNGTPFCYFQLGDVLVVSTYEGRALSLVRDFGLVREVQLLDIPTVTEAAQGWGELTAAEADKLSHTQFRSLEFLPLVARWVYEGRDVPSTTQPLAELPQVHGSVWFVDNFGNAKTTLLADQINFADGQTVKLADGQAVKCYQRLADVPTGQVAVTVGSSGYQDRRFLEVVVQRGSAAEKLGLGVGNEVLA